MVNVLDLKKEKRFFKMKLTHVDKTFPSMLCCCKTVRLHSFWTLENDIRNTKVQTSVKFNKKLF